MKKIEPKRDVSRWFSPIQMLELDSCVKCQECVSVCPTVTLEYPDGAMERINNWKKLNPPTSFSIILQDKQISQADTLTRLSRGLSRCTTCGICAVVCESGILTTPLWESMRGACRDLGYSDESLETKAEAIIRNKNPYDEDPLNRSLWIPPSTLIDETASIAFFPGCTIAYRNPELGKAALRILATSGTRFSVLGNEEFCCGSFLFRTGSWREYSDTILTMIQKIQENGITEVLVPCAGCLKTIILEWPQVYGRKLPFRVTSFSAYIRDCIRENKIRFESDKNLHVIYHDPCHGGRHLMHHLGEDIVFEAPREVISAIPGVTLHEFSKNRQYQGCCGAGGGLKTHNSTLSLTIARKKIEPVHQIGVDILVSICPFCERNFTDAMITGDYSFKVMDLIELVDRVMIRSTKESA